MWKGHFDKLLNCVKNETNRHTVENAIHEISPDDNLTITPDMVGCVIKKLKLGKSCGPLVEMMVSQVNILNLLTNVKMFLYHCFIHPFSYMVIFQLIL